MKKTLTIITVLVALSASAQHSYISTSGNLVLESGSIERFANPDIYVDAQYNTINGTWTATLSLFATGATTNIVRTMQITFDDATIDALTPSGTTTTQKTKNCILQAVEDYLTPFNGSVTFTLN